MIPENRQQLSLSDKESSISTPGYLTTSVADPDPHVFGPPGSGSISQKLDPDPTISSSKNSKKNLDSNYFVTLFLTFYL
jgi:hypothetical protein